MPGQPGRADRRFRNGPDCGDSHVKFRTAVADKIPVAPSWKITPQEIAMSPKRLEMYQKLCEKGLWYAPAGALADAITNSALGVVYVCGGVVLSLASAAGFIRIARIYDKQAAVPPTPPPAVASTTPTPPPPPHPAPSPSPAPPVNPPTSPIAIP
jgi:hypothetical protein